MKASPSLLSKTRLFISIEQARLALLLFGILFSISLFLEYQSYRELTEFDTYTSRAWVENQYRKNDQWVLKLQSEEGFTFYTTSKEDLRDLSGYRVQVKLFINKLSFPSYLKGFYAPTFIMSRESSKQKRYLLMDKLKDIHSGDNAFLFQALFFAGPLHGAFREKLSAWGINHLLAISGFHLGVLGLVLFFLFSIVYKPVQDRFFPYRNAHRDISVMVMGILFFYLYFLDFVPSLLRAFAMTLFGYLLHDRGVKIVSFSSLLIVVSFLIAIWPKLLFTLGFWFSVAGVFYILLFLHHMQELKAWQSFILLHLWVYLAMLPIVHLFFGTFSLYQLLSPLLTMLFILFYPLELLLHLLGEGAMLDPLLESLFSIKMRVKELLLPLWSLFLYLILSLFAIFHRLFFLSILFFNLGLLGYFLYRIAEL